MNFMMWGECVWANQSVQNINCFCVYVNMHNNGRQYWVSAVHMNFMWGEYVWANQSVQNVNWFLCVFTERITDSWRQGWDDGIHERGRYSVYRIFKLERDRYSVYRIFKIERDRYSVYRIFKLERDRYSVYRIFKLERDRYSVYRIFKLEHSLEHCQDGSF